MYAQNSLVLKVSTIYILYWQEKMATILAQSKAEELLVQVGAINNAQEQIGPISQTPQTPDVSGLALPAQLNINISTGCKQSRQVNVIGLGVIALSSIPYISEVI